MKPKKVIQRKSIDKRREPEDLTEEEVLEEYQDVFDAVIDMENDGRLIFNYSHGNTSLECAISIYAKYDALKKENQQIFLDEVYTDWGFDAYYKPFIEGINEMVKEIVPELKYDILEDLTGFVGRSGGHFQMHVRLPESFKNVKHYVDGFMSYDLFDVNYETVMEYVEAINKLVDWLGKFVIDYWNSVCELIKEDMAED